ncbi:AzlC family ABC transporter permease [Halocella sp. SP3-1]|uniref:AzlC family ABC transporter permease n=1 Tax=Halocella sp. SP3-1 TaxID=2382161 RepID=UPI000F75C5D2|nr:AzlC family ABC transporter permease [Halocella sp. SP3-1]AZO94815.1 branched-chain amino acid ABC transporter permease [Halocella sp. SP3-1]
MEVVINEKIKDRDNFGAGVKKGLTIAFGYIPIAIAFGILARSNGIPLHIIIAMSIIVYAGASQFVAVKLIALNAGLWGIVLATFILNLRHFLMSASVSQRINKKTATGLLAIISFGITDESFSLISLSEEKVLDDKYIFGINLIAYLSWVAGTVIGVFMGTTLPEIIQSSMGIALYSMFIGLLIPALKKSREVKIIALISIIISSFLYWGPSFISSISDGWKIIIATITAAGIAAFFFPDKEEGWKR